MADALLSRNCCRCCRRASPSNALPLGGVDRRRAGGRGDGLCRLAGGEARQRRCCDGASAVSTPDSASRPTPMPARSGWLLRVSVLVLVVYGGLLLLTYWNFKTTPKGFIPDAGHGLPDGERATARRGLGRAVPQGHRPRAADLPEHARESSTPCPWPARRSPSSVNASNFGSMFVILDTFCQSRGAGAVGRRDRRQACACDVPRRSPRRW